MLILILTIILFSFQIIEENEESSLIRWVGYDLPPEWLPNSEIKDIKTDAFAEIKDLILFHIKKALRRSLNPYVKINISVSKKAICELKKHFCIACKKVLPPTCNLDVKLRTNWNTRKIKNDCYRICPGSFKWGIIKARKPKDIIDIEAPYNLIIKFIREFVPPQNVV